MNNVKLYNKSNSLQKTSAILNLTEYMDIINWKKDSLILDIGCGDGSVTTTLIKSTIQDCKTVTGCDINENMIRFANDHYSSENVNFTIIDIEGELPDYLRERFHHAISFFALHWCLNQETTFQNIYNLLKEDGNCFAILVGKASIFDAYRVLAKAEKWKPWLMDVEKYISPYHDSQDPIRHMEQLLRKIGFTKIKLEDKLLSHEYESLEHLRGGIMSVVPFKIPDEMADEFFMDLCLEMQMTDTEKYNFEKSTNDFVFTVHTLIVYVEK